MRYLDELKDLKLSNRQYTILGSGPLAIRGFRENTDIDIVVKLYLWEKLENKYSKIGGVILTKFNNDEALMRVGNVEISKKWFGLFDVDKLISNSRIIKNFPFASLEDTLKSKLFLNRDKDREDIEVLRGIVLYTQYKEYF